MKKRGFTLIEVLFVIVIIAVIAVIISPIIINIINKNREEMYKNQISTIEEAAKRWSASNSEKIPDEIMNDEEKSFCLSLDELAESGFISGSDLTNPVNDEDLEGSILITYNQMYEQFVFKFVTTKCE